ncbi:hypothetical protein WJX73_003731 [Symbiochloris irregularis]|uniref:Thioredoxin domain-containing protein n=1 Tax=Symbiochloris irregularis TaxID=706552 RepID=A0AAW1NX32_9CHLO
MAFTSGHQGAHQTPAFYATAAAAQQGEADGSTNTAQQSQASGPSAPSGAILAVGSVAIGVVAFLATRITPGVPSLDSLEKASIPLDSALANGKPSLIEFYANWCTTCKESAPEVFKAEQAHKNDLNLVMLNIDNPKWLPEARQYQVRGIPHFVFLDQRGRQLGTAVGRFPQSILDENVTALAKGVPLPFTQARGAASSLEQQPGSKQKQQQQIAPRSHSSS